MAYATKYICTFDNVRLDIPSTPEFTIQFQFKDYTGEAYNIKGGADVVKHAWDTDDPHGTIKGSSLSITLLNEAQQTPLLSFATLEDDGVKVILLWKGQIVFVGFLVQDDCLETMVDYTHEISLTANDNLGLLKNVPINQVFTLSTTYTQVEIGAQDGKLLLYNSQYVPQIGIPIQVVNHPFLNGIYTPSAIISAPGYYELTVDPATVGSVVDFGDLKVSNINLEKRQPLLTLIQLCLSNTGVLLPVNIYCNLEEVSFDPAKVLFDQTLIDPQTFLKGDNNYEDCYSVLEKILKRFNLTIFQSSGLWNIIRWDEVRFYNNLIHGFIYDENFNYIGPIFGELFLPAPINCGISENLVWETAPNHKLVRPFLFNKETFNYKQPVTLLKNFNLQQTGNLLRAYTEGSGADLHYINEYEALYFDIIPGSYAGSPEYYIRVTIDTLGNEVGRSLIVINGAINSTPIEASKDDNFTFSFTVITNVSRPGNINVIFEVKITDGTQTKYLHEDGTWQGTRGWTLNVPSGDNANTSHSYDFTGRESIPFDGLLTFSLEDYGAGAFETQYTDIRLDYIFTINQSTKVIGHTHTSSQGGNIKLNEDEEIFIDSSPRNSIAGTLFRKSMNGLLQARTTQWNMPGQTPKNLGEITTGETITWRRSFRSVIEGTLVSQTNLPDYISLLNVIKYNYFPTLNFIWGKLEIDYRNNTMTGTLWEMYADGELDLLHNYLFKYLYAAK